MAFPGLTRLFRLVVRPPTVEQEIDAEIEFHLEEEARALIAKGMVPDAARREAQLRFGDLQHTRAALARLDRERRMKTRRAGIFEDFSQDLGYALRGIRRQPGFSMLVILTLALGIGANATMFGIVDRILVRPPSFLEEPAQTGRIYLRRPDGQGAERIDNNISYQRYVDLRDGSRTISAAAFFDDDQTIIGTGEGARQLGVSMVSASFWQMFEIAPVVGRFFTAAEDRAPSGSPVTVLGYGFWQSSFGGGADVVGKSVFIGSRPYTVIGVAPRGFTGVSPRQVAAFVPITAAAFDEFGDYYATSGHNLSWLEVLARRKPGVSREAADADLTLAFQRSRAAEPRIRPETIARSRVELAPVLYDRGPHPRNEARVAEWLAGVAVIVLLIACANVANLLLARALRRRREIAVRLALGISRRRLLRQLLTESTLLALFGGAAGLVLAHVGGGILRRALIPDVDWSATPLFDTRILVFTAAVALVTGILTGLVPAWHAGRSDVAGALKAGGRESSRPRARLRTTLLVAQAALSVVLLVGAGLFVKSLRNVRAVNLGYEPGRVLVVNTDLRGERMARPDRAELTRRLLEGARELPGVERATLTFGVPFWRSNTTDLFVPGRDSLTGLGAFYQNTVGEDYFETTGTAILRGRGLTLQDRTGSARVAVVSEMLAHKVWPAVDPLGQCLKVEADTMPCSTVVGIAGDVRWGSLGDEDRMQVYLPLPTSDPAWLFVRASGDTRRLVEPLRRVLQGLMPGAAYVRVRTLDSTLDPILRPWRLGAAMFTLFGGLALVVAAVGLYSVIAYSVAQRLHEMGVRVALGARTGDLLRLVVGEGVRVAVLGIVFGAAGALATGKLIASLLFGVPSNDPFTFAVVTVVLLVVATLASLVPAWRASRADPNLALRAE